MRKFNFAAAYPELGIGFVGVAKVLGCMVVTIANAIGHISGCHLNPERNTSQALYAGEWALNQLKLFGLLQLLEQYWEESFIKNITRKGIKNSKPLTKQLFFPKTPLSSKQRLNGGFAYKRFFINFVYV